MHQSNQKQKVHRNSRLHRFSGHRVCDNPQVRGDHLEEAVWDQVKGLLEDPHRVAGEYRRRLLAARDQVREPEEIVRL
ncbi:zinc ribbon domain-containing protein (plasmid) [Nitrobacter sp. NHB1]|uniref:zinc ribbon domain-containing protein n=1 Tax=Nitrobacter sp. NHB1 TaxID=3119830 RepID=UPI003000B6AB